MRDLRFVLYNKPIITKIFKDHTHNNTHKHRSLLYTDPSYIQDSTRKSPERITHIYYTPKHRTLLQDSTSKSPEMINTHKIYTQTQTPPTRLDKQITGKDHTHKLYKQTQTPRTRLDKQITGKDHTHTNTYPSYKTRQANRWKGSHIHKHRPLLQDSASKSPERITHINYTKNTDPSYKTRQANHRKGSHTQTQIFPTRLDKQIAGKDHTHTNTDPSNKTNHRKKYHT